MVRVDVERRRNALDARPRRRRRRRGRPRRRHITTNAILQLGGDFYPCDTAPSLPAREQRAEVLPRVVLRRDCGRRLQLRQSHSCLRKSWPRHLGLKECNCIWHACTFFRQELLAQIFVAALHDLWWSCARRGFWVGTGRGNRRPPSLRHAEECRRLSNIFVEPDACSSIPSGSGWRDGKCFAASWVSKTVAIDNMRISMATLALVSGTTQVPRRRHLADDRYPRCRALLVASSTSGDVRRRSRDSKTVRASARSVGVWQRTMLALDDRVNLGRLPHLVGRRALHARAVHRRRRRLILTLQASSAPARAELVCDDAAAALPRRLRVRQGPAVRDLVYALGKQIGRRLRRPSALARVAASACDGGTSSSATAGRWATPRSQRRAEADAFMISAETATSPPAARPRCLAHRAPRNIVRLRDVFLPR